MERKCVALITTLCVVVACSGVAEPDASGASPTLQVGSVAAILLTPPGGRNVVGETRQFAAQAFDSAGAAVTTPITWTSSSPAVASVSATGYVSALVPGVTTIKAVGGGISKTVRFEVSTFIPAASQSLADIVITPPLARMRVGGTVQLTATLYTADGDLLYAVPLSWSTVSNAASSVASVSQAGVVTARGIGTEVIQAQNGFIASRTTVMVVP